VSESAQFKGSLDALTSEIVSSPDLPRMILFLGGVPFRYPSGAFLFPFALSQLASRLTPILPEVSFPPPSLHDVPLPGRLAFVKHNATLLDSRSHSTVVLLGFVPGFKFRCFLFVSLAEAPVTVRSQAVRPRKFYFSNLPPPNRTPSPPSPGRLFSFST